MDQIEDLKNAITCHLFPHFGASTIHDQGTHDDKIYQLSSGGNLVKTYHDSVGDIQIIR